MFGKKIIYAILLLFIGALGGWLLHSFFAAPIAKGTLLRDNASNYSFISPLLACDVGPEDAFPEFDPIKNALNAVITTEEKAGATQSVSIYLRSLKGGRWFEINGNTTYAPASMLKVFIMTAFYKEAEDTPVVLDRQVAFEGSVNPAADTPGEVIPHLTNSQLYSIQALINQMIIYSDNDAMTTLVDHFDRSTLTAFNNLFTELNIPSPAAQNESAINFMSVSQYSLVFRVLYSATYLSADDSERALKLLSQAQYTDGIVAGVPDGTIVAHKFGVATTPVSGSTPAADELHDCGLVYYPSHPYLLCIMTRGTDFAILQNDLRDISATTYNQIDAFYKK